MNVKSLRYVAIALLLLAVGIVSLFRVWHGREAHDRVPAGGEAAPFTETPEQAAAAWRSRGALHEQEGAFKLAINAYTEAIRLGGPHSPTYYDRARCYISIGMFEDALADYSAIIRLGEGEWSTHASRATCHARLGNQDSAYAEYSKAIALDLNNAALHRARATTTRDHDRSLADFAEAIRLGSDDSETYFFRGEFYRTQLDNYEKAIEDYTKAIELDATNAWYFQGRGLAFRSLGRPREVIADFSKAIELNPEMPSEIFRDRAAAYEKVGDLAGAIADYTTLIRRNPESLDSHMGRAMAWMQKEEFDKAIADFREAARLDSDWMWYPAHRGLVEAYWRNGNLDEVIAYSSRALAKWPNDSDICLLRGHAHVAKGRLESALSDYTAAAMGPWKKPEALECRGRVYERLGDKESAEEDFAEAKRLRAEDEADDEDAWTPQ